MPLSPEKKREYDKQYRAENIEKIKARESTPEKKAHRAAQLRRRRAANPELARAKDRAFRARNLEKVRAEETARYNRTWMRRIARRLGVPEARLREAYGDGRCQICHNPDGRRLSADHCHKTNIFRGFLCGGCNLMIGNGRDSPATLEAGAAYLRASL